MLLPELRKRSEAENKRYLIAGFYYKRKERNGNGTNCANSVRYGCSRFLGFRSQFSRSVAGKLVSQGSKLIDRPNYVCDIYSCRSYSSAIELDVTLGYDEAIGYVKHSGTILHRIVDSLLKSDVLICDDNVQNLHLLCKSANTVFGIPAPPRYPTHFSKWSNRSSAILLTTSAGTEIHPVTISDIVSL